VFALYCTPQPGGGRDEDSLVYFREMHVFATDFGITPALVSRNKLMTVQPSRLLLLSLCYR
jgi:hypothetical protein